MTTKSQSHTVPLGEIRQARRSRVSLVFYAREGDRTVTLSPGETIVVGRSSPAELQIMDASLSREHARLSVLEDSALQIEDLNSSNGTFLNGEPIEAPTILAPGDQLELGAVVVGVHVLAAGAKRISGLMAHDAFIKQLNDEVTRGLEYGRPLTVAMLKTEGHVDSVVPEVLESLRRIDRAARYSNDTLELYLPELSHLDAEEALKKVWGATGGKLRVAFTTVPAGGRTAMELHARARDALPATPSVVCGDRELTSKADASAPIIVDAKMRQLYDHVERAAQSTIPVLVHGETGSGKGWSRGTCMSSLAAKASWCASTAAPSPSR
jgi:hypothetical protein